MSYCMSWGKHALGKRYCTTSSTYDPIDSNSVQAQHIAGSDGEHVGVAVEAVEHAAQPVAFPAA